MAVQDYKINYKSDFVLNINGDAGWATQFCIKFWTGMPSQAYFVGFDGVKYVNCRVGDTPTQLLVMFDDHHLPIGPLRMQIAYHTTIEEFPGSVFDEVTNARDVIVTIDGTDYQVMLDFTGEDAPELEFNLPAYANEAERIQNELQRQQNEADRIAAELQREQATAAAVQGAENVNAQLNGTTLTVTNRQGVSTSVNTKGEQGEQGPVGPEGPQGQKGVSVTGLVKTGETDTDTLYNVTFSDGTTQAVAIPKGAKGDTGATGPTGPQGPQGQTGVSITGLVKTGETETDTLYNVTFSNGTTQAVAIPKGEKGDQGPVGPQGPQGPMGDVAVITPEQQAAFTMYSTTGQNTNGPMTQKAVTDELTIAQNKTIDYTQASGKLNLPSGATAYVVPSNNMVTRYIPVVAGNTYQISGNYSGSNVYARIGFATSVPAGGVAATVIYDILITGGFTRTYKPTTDGYLSISHFNQSGMTPAVFKLIGTPLKNKVSELDSQMVSVEEHTTTHNVENDDDCDFSIGNNSFDIVQFKNGHIKTKYFDSKDLTTAAELLVRFKGKILGIIGDSISTFQDTMPSGYANYYTTSNLGSVNNIWWKIVCDKLGMIGTNCAWSGSLVEGNSGTSSAEAGCSTKRIQDLGRNGNPDIIMCFISCNDWRYGSDHNYTLGTWKVSDPIDVTDRTITNFREAYAVMLYKLTTTYPDARIFVCTNLDDPRRDQTSGWPSNNSNGISTHEWNQNIKEIGEALGASIIDVHSCGITFANMPNYSVDGGTHPNVAGQAMIASKVLSQLISKY